MTGNGLISMLTEHFQKRKSHARPLLFAVKLNNEAVFFTPIAIAETPQGVVVNLRKVV